MSETKTINGNGSESNNQSHVVKIKLVRYNDLINIFQSKLVLNGNIRIPILEPYYIYSNKTELKNQNGFGDIFIKLRQILDGKSISNNYTGSIINGQNLFKIEKIYTQDNYYVFLSTDKQYFYVNIDEFDKKGINSESFKPGKPQITGVNIVKNFNICTDNGTINLLTKKSIFSTLVGDLITIIDKDNGDVVLINENCFEYINIDENGKQTALLDPICHNYGKIIDIKTDLNSNFLLIVSEYDNDIENENANKITKLHILNRKTLEEIDSIPDIVQIFHIDKKNDVICVDKDGIMVNINTNFDQFPRGFVDENKFGKKQIQAIVDISQSQLLQALSAGDLDIDPAQITSGTTNQLNGSTDNTILQNIWNIKIGDKSMQEIFDAANDNQSINFLYNAFLMIKSNAVLAPFDKLISQIESQINQKKFMIKLDSLKQKFEKLKQNYEMLKVNHTDLDSSAYNVLVALNLELKSHKNERSQVPLIDFEFDQEFMSFEKIILDKITSFQNQNIEIVEKQILTDIEKLKLYVNGINFLNQITQVYDNSIYQSIENQIQYLPIDKQQEYSNQLKQIISTKIAQISKQQQDEQKQLEESILKKSDELKSLIGDLDTIIGAVEKEDVLDMMKTSDSLVNKIRGEILDLPKSQAEKLILYLENVFTQRKQEIRLKNLETRGTIASLDEYGIDTSLYYTDREKQTVGYKVVGHKNADQSIRLELLFEDGTVFNLDRYMQNPGNFEFLSLFEELSSQMTQKDFINLQSEISRWKSKGQKELERLNMEFFGEEIADKKAMILDKIKTLKSKYKQARVVDFIAKRLTRRFNLNPRARLELPNPRFIILDEEKELLSKMSAGFNIQKQEQKGIDILEGPPGLGKTEITRFFSAVTNREIVRVQCSKMDPADLFFSPQLKAGETTRQPAEWITLMQKPGTVILFDEIDKLNPQSFERLHSLFDNARGIYDPQLGWIKAHPDCLFVGTRNSYEKLSNPIVSRSTIIQIVPPSEVNEAYKISKYSGIEYFNKLSFEEFKNMYNSLSTLGTNDESTKKLNENLGYIKSLINVFVSLRKAQCSDDFSDKFEYEISYRDAEQIFLRYIKLKNNSFKEVVLDVLVPKARAVVQDFSDKDIQEKIVKDIVDAEFK